MQKLIYGIVVLVFLVIGCAQVDRVSKPPEPVDVEQVVRAGLDSLDAGNWQAAARAFNRAIQADPDYSPAYSGMALVLAERERPDKALEYANRAVAKEPKSVQAHVVKGRILLMADDYSNAITALDEALKINPRNEEALFYKAQAASKAHNYELAENVLQTLVEQEGEYKDRARELFEQMHKAQLAAPQTGVGEKMLQTEAISRGDLAALLVNEIGLLSLVNRRNPNFYATSNSDDGSEVSIVDINGHWAEPWIRDVVRVGAMDVYPDNSFRPNAPVQRMNFAMTLQNVFILVTGDRTLDTAFVGSGPRYPDVKPTHYAFNAISLVTEYGIMGTHSLTGEFDLNSTVSGADALIALRKLERALNTTM